MEIVLFLEIKLSYGSKEKKQEHSSEKKQE
jgi:hypothetical protein